MCQFVSHHVIAQNRIAPRSVPRGLPLTSSGLSLSSRGGLRDFYTQNNRRRNSGVTTSGVVVKAAMTTMNGEPASGGQMMNPLLTVRYIYMYSGLLFVAFEV